MRIGLAALIAALLALAGATRSAEACSCARPPPPADAYGAADAVVLGTVAEMSDDHDAAGRIDVEIDASRWFKGEGGERTRVRTMASSAMCGFPFEEGRAYLIYARTQSEGDELHVSLCSRTRPADRAEDDIEVLEELGRDEGADSEAQTPNDGDQDEGAQGPETPEDEGARDDGADGGAQDEEAQGPETPEDEGARDEGAQDGSDGPDTPGDLGGRSSEKGRGCAAAGAGGLAGWAALALAAALARGSRRKP